jgi:citrate synthase
MGWMAHSMEQYATGELICPRARYTGLEPEGCRAGAVSR